MTERRILGIFVRASICGIIVLLMAAILGVVAAQHLQIEPLHVQWVGERFAERLSAFIPGLVMAVCGIALFVIAVLQVRRIRNSALQREPDLGAGEQQD